MNEDVVYAIGVEPHRIDILMSIDGLKFDAAWSHRVRTTYGDVAIAVPSRPDLIKAKLAAGRPQDLLDVATLRTKPKALSQLRARSKKSKRK
ncbi:MAG: hypothetical protein IT449_17080 [Phycisphaerales bacterium]|nr:hypothetical protein [Phycisphaerales bacterium]